MAGLTMGETSIPPLKAEDAGVHSTWAILASAVPVHVALALATDLSPDEAYYLCAARASRAIVDHPPLTVWMLAATDRIVWAPVELRVRVWAIAFSFSTSAAVVQLARARGAKPGGATLAAWVGTWALLPMAGGFVTTPDTALLLAVALALLGMDRSALLTGAALFAAALAKVIAVPIGALLAIGGLASPGAPARRAHIASVVGPALALPFLVPSLRFQIRHAFGGRTDWSLLAAIGAPLAAIGAQAALWSPGVVWMGARALGVLTYAERALVLGVTGLVLVSGVVRGVPPEPNWWAPSAILVIVALAVRAADISPSRRRILLATILIPTFVALAHTARPFLPLGQGVDPTARLHGWSGGSEPLAAPGLGRYGVAAERCVYRGACDDITSYFNEMNAEMKGR